MTDISPEKVARYSPTTAEDWRGMAGGIYAKMRRETNGDYVSFSDYEALAARLAEAEAELSSGSFYKEADADWIIKRAEAAEAERDALRARLAEVEAKSREMAMQSLADLGQAQEAYEAQLAAEAERDALRADVERLKAVAEAIRTALREALTPLPPVDLPLQPYGATDAE